MATKPTLFFSNDGQSLIFTSMEEGQTDVWKRLERTPKNSGAEHTVQCRETHRRYACRKQDAFSRFDSKQLIMQQGRGDLVSLNLESKEKRTLVTGFSDVEFDIAPDSRWIVYANQDNDFNSEIWLLPLDGDLEPTNVSRHPDNDGNPRFSPDGKLLAFTGRRLMTKSMCTTSTSAKPTTNKHRANVRSKKHSN